MEIQHLLRTAFFALEHQLAAVETLAIQMIPIGILPILLHVPRVQHMYFQLIRARASGWNNDKIHPLEAFS
jgi:hypothetical protein